MASSWKIFGYRTHRNRDPWRDAPPWAIEQRNMTAAYFHSVLTKLNGLRAGELTPEQQKQVDEMYDTATRDVREMDAALTPDARPKSSLSPAGDGSKSTA